MKHVLFCLQTMTRGGVEKELITILKEMDTTKIKATVLLMYIQDFDVINELPNDVSIINLAIDQNYYCSDLVSMVGARLKRLKFVEALMLIIRRILRIGMPHSNQMIDEIPVIEDSFDVAVCYHIHSPIMLKYVVEKVHAKKRIGFIHNDFTTSGYPVGRLKNILREYDEFIAVSNTVAEEYKAFCPEFISKISVIHNILNPNETRALANQVPLGDLFDDMRPKLLSVGRLVEQKGFDIAINVCDILRNKGLVFCWYIIGGGTDYDKLRLMIKEKNLSEYFVLLGQISNPYPYIRDCDIYIQPSRHEAFCITILEAIIFEKPIVCTHFAGSDEQIINGVTGYIVPLGDTVRLAERIADLIANETERARLSSNLKKMSIIDEEFKNNIKILEDKFCK